MFGRPAIDGDRLLVTADAAFYLAKAQGRDRVIEAAGHRERWAT